MLGFSPKHRQARYPDLIRPQPSKRPTGQSHRLSLTVPPQKTEGLPTGCIWLQNNCSHPNSSCGSLKVRQPIAEWVIHQAGKTKGPLYNNCIIADRTKGALISVYPLVVDTPLLPCTSHLKQSSSSQVGRWATVPIS